MEKEKTNILAPTIGLNIPLPEEARVETIADRHSDEVKMLKFLRDEVAPAVRNMEFGEDVSWGTLPENKSAFAFAQFFFFIGRGKKPGESTRDWAEACGSKACLGGWYKLYAEQARASKETDASTSIERLRMAYSSLARLTKAGPIQDICAGSYVFTSPSRGQYIGSAATRREFEARISAVDDVIRAAENTPA